MLVRDASRLSNRVFVVAGLLGLFAACQREPEPVPKKTAARRAAPAAAGGASAVARQALSFAGNAGAPAMPTSSESGVALGNIKPFTAAADKPAKVQYIDERYDSKNQFDVAKNRFKAAKAGSYHVCAALAAAGKDFSLSVYVNGARESVLAESSRGFAQGCRTVVAKANDTLEVWVQHSAGEALEFAADDALNWLTIDMVPGLLSLSDVNAFNAPPSTFTKVPFSAENANPELWDGKNHRFVANTTGNYHVCVALTSGSTDFELDMALNGNRENAFTVSTRGVATGCRTVRLAKGSYVEVWAHPAGTAPLAFAANKAGNWLTIDKASAAETRANVSLDNTNALTVPPNTYTKVPYVTVTYDDAHQFDLATSSFTASAANDYRVCASIAPLKHEFELSLYVNGARDKVLSLSQLGVGHGCRTVRLRHPGEFVEVWVKQAGTAPAVFDANQFWNWITIDPVGTM
jgi:hypothetical protein